MGELRAATPWIHILNYILKLRLIKYREYTKRQIWFQMWSFGWLLKDVENYLKHL